MEALRVPELKNANVNNESEPSVDTSPRASVSALRAKFTSHGDQVMGKLQPQQKSLFCDLRYQRQFSSSNSVIILKNKLHDSRLHSNTLPQAQGEMLSAYNDGSGSFRSHCVSSTTVDTGPLHCRPFLVELSAVLKYEQNKNEKPAPGMGINVPKNAAESSQEHREEQSENHSLLQKNHDIDENHLKEIIPLPTDLNISCNKQILEKNAKNCVSFKLRPLPPQERFGPPPLKPPRPPNVDLAPFLHHKTVALIISKDVVPDVAPVPPPRSSKVLPALPICPPRPPPKCIPSIPGTDVTSNPLKPPKTDCLYDDSEELYEDTAVMDQDIKLCETTSAADDLEQLKQEFQEQCNNTVEDAQSSAFTTSSEELYQDTNEVSGFEKSSLLENFPLAYLMSREESTNV